MNAISDLTGSAGGKAAGGTKGAHHHGKAAAGAFASLFNAASKTDDGTGQADATADSDPLAAMIGALAASTEEKGGEKNKDGEGDVTANAQLVTDILASTDGVTPAVPVVQILAAKAKTAKAVDTTENASVDLGLTTGITDTPKAPAKGRTTASRTGTKDGLEATGKGAKKRAKDVDAAASPATTATAAAVVTTAAPAPATLAPAPATAAPVPAASAPVPATSAPAPAASAPVPATSAPAPATSAPAPATAAPASATSAPAPAASAPALAPTSSLTPTAGVAAEGEIVPLVRDGKSEKPVAETGSRRAQANTGRQVQAARSQTAQAQAARGEAVKQPPVSAATQQVQAAADLPDDKSRQTKSDPLNGQQEATDRTQSAQSTSASQPTDILQALSTASQTRVDASGAGGGISGQAPTDVGAVLSGQVIDMGVGGQWIDRLATEIAAVADGSGHSRFQLSPPNLGRLQIDIWQGDGGASVRMLTETDEAANRLQTGKASLEADARVSALSLNSIMIDHSPGAFGASTDSSGQNPSRHQPAGSFADQAGTQAGSGNSANSGSQAGNGSNMNQDKAPFRRDVFNSRTQQDQQDVRPDIRRDDRGVRYA
jgi:hypothetical protein